MSLHYQSGSLPKNNGGTVVSHNITSSVLSDIAPNAGATLAYTSGPKNNNTADKAYSGSSFAKYTDSLLAMRSDAVVATVGVFKNASIYPEYLTSIHYLESRTTTKNNRK